MSDASEKAKAASISFNSAATMSTAIRQSGKWPTVLPT